MANFLTQQQIAARDLRKSVNLRYFQSFPQCKDAKMIPDIQLSYYQAHTGACAISMKMEGETEEGGEERVQLWRVNSRSLFPSLPSSSLRRRFPI